MGFSITSAVLGGVIIICYSIAISELRRYHSYYDYDYYGYYERYYYNYRGKMAILAINAYPGHCYIRCWNLGSDLHLFDEAMRLLRTAGGKLIHFTFLLYFKSGAVPHHVCWQKRLQPNLK